MNLQQIKYIVAVEKNGSFGKAAAECFIGQSTLSTMISRFEDEIGIRIFDRKTKPVSITEEGSHVINQLKQITREIGSLQEVVSSLKGELTGELKIGIIPTIAPYLLPLFFNDFTSRNPQIHFIISEMTTEKLILELNNRSLDVAIMSTPLKQPNLVEHHIYDEPFYLYDGASCESQKEADASEIDCNRLWLMDEGHCLRNQVEVICDLKKKQRRLSNLEYKSGSLDTLMRFVKKYEGITLLPYLATLDMTAGDSAQLRKFKTPIPSRAISIVVHEHFVKRRILSMLSEEIRNCIDPILKVNKGLPWVVKPSW